MVKGAGMKLNHYKREKNEGIPRKLRITYVKFFASGIYFEKLSGYTDNIKRQNC